MKVKIDKSRRVYKGTSNSGRINENKYEVLEFVFPEELEDFTKYIEIEATDNEGTLRYADRIEDNEFAIDNTLSKYSLITAQVVCKDLRENVVFKSNPFEFTFEQSLNIMEDIEEEQHDLLDRIELELQEAKEDITDLQETQEQHTEQIQTNETNIEDLQGRVATNITDIANIKTKNTQQDNAIATNTQDISNIKAEQTTQNTNIAGNTNRITVLEHDSGNKVALSINSDYVMTLQLLNKNNEVLSTGTIDLPIESMIVNASYSNGILTLTLQNGRTLDVDISDIVSGLVSETTFNSAISELQGSINSLTTRMTQAETNIQENTDDIETLETKHDTEVAELNEKIADLQEKVDMAEDLIPTDSPEISDNITLSDSARYYFKKMVLGGKSEQESYTGKNIVKSLYYKGASTLNFYINEKKVVSSMIISGITNVSVNNMTIYLKFGSVTYTLATFNMIANQKFNVSITLTEEQINAIKEAENVYIQLYRPSASSADLSTCTYDEMMLRDSSTTDTYEKYVGGQPAPNPDYECPIHNVTGNVEVKVENKNLLNMSALVQGIYNSSSSAPTMPPVLGSINDKRYRSFSGTLKAGTYTICFDKANSIIRDFTSNDYSSNSTMGIGASNITNATFTITERSTIYISFRKYDGTDWDNSDLVWLVSGSTVTDYIEHEEQTVTFPLEEGQILHASDTIEDKIVQKRKTLVFDGTENWNLFFSTEGIFTRSLSDIAVDKISSVNAKSNYFIGSSRNYIRNNLSTVDNRISCYGAELTIANKSITTAADFKAWVAEKYANGTPLTVEYELAEPIETEFTEAQRTAKAQIDKLYSYKGTTHITSNANLDVTYRKDLETIIDNLSNAIVAQGGI